MEKNVYLLYSGNAWLNTSSLQLLSVCTTVERAIELAVEHADGGEEPLDDESKEELESQSQTYGRDENYLICETELDQLG